jgi:hypothetical protein
MAASKRPPTVFINCPFDSDYQSLFDAIVFTVARCGFAPRCAKEIDDAAGTRIDKIAKLIEECPLAIHDISRTELDNKSKLPRFNMPFELGLFIGACRFGNVKQRKKRCLVFDKSRFRYQKFLSDIAGQDIHAHEAKQSRIIIEVRNFLHSNANGRHIPGGNTISKQFAEFKKRKPTICEQLELDPHDLTFLDFTNLVAVYLEQNA